MLVNMLSQWTSMKWHRLKAIFLAAHQIAEGPKWIRISYFRHSRENKSVDPFYANYIFFGEEDVIKPFSKFTTVQRLRFAILGCYVLISKLYYLPAKSENRFHNYSGSQKPQSDLHKARNDSYGKCWSMSLLVQSHFPLAWTGVCK